MSRRVVIVTGGGRGIGRAICVRFGREGAHVVAAARSADQLEATRAAVKVQGGSCSTEVVDVNEVDEINAMVERTAKQHGHIDVLVNNAGIAPVAPIEDLEPAVFDSLISVNCRAMYAACRAAWPIMKAQGGGDIVNISSIASKDPFPGFTAYGATKAWVNSWTHGLAAEGKSVGIRVFAVAPGGVETKMLRDVFPDFPSQDILQPEEVAELVYTLTQPVFRSSSGQTIFIQR